MVSKYFKFKLKTEAFNRNLDQVIQELNGKNILVCADKNEFKILDKKYNLTSKLNISSIALCELKQAKKYKPYKGINVIHFNDINNQKFDEILITSEISNPIYHKLTVKYGISESNIKSLFIELVKDEQINLPYALNKDFEKYFKNLKKKLKNKQVMFYGAGIFLKLLHEYFDFSGLNVIGVVDKKYKNINEDKEFLGYKTFKPEHIISENPDYLIIATKIFIPIFESLYFGYLENTKIKMIPIVKKNIFNLLLEIDN